MDQDSTWHGGGSWSRPHCARWGLSPLPLRGTAPQFLANVHCGQMAGWTKMPLGMEVGLDPGDFVFDGDPATPRKSAHPPHPIFGPCLLWPNGWMDLDAIWYGDKHRSRRCCVRWARWTYNAWYVTYCMPIKVRPRQHGMKLVVVHPSRSSPLKGAQHSQFSVHVCCGQTAEDTTCYGNRPRPRPHCIRWGPSSPVKEAQQPSPSFWPMSVVASRQSQLLLRSCFQFLFSTR